MIVDLVIPAFNEAEALGPLAAALEPHRGRVRHVVLADNGSTDGTGDLARSAGFVVVEEPARGYGSACLKALDWIARQPEPPGAVAFLDADLADRPGGLPALLGPIERGEADLVIGSRPALSEPGALSPVQRFGNALACSMIAVLGGRRFTDLGPFRAVRWSTLEDLAMADRTWGWTVEMQMKAALLGIPSAEVDVPYHRRRYGRSKISGTVRGVVMAGSKIIATILVLWWRRGAIRAAAARTPEHAGA